MVSTSVGAEGIEAEPGTHLLIADSPEEFAESVHQVLKDPVFAASLATNARAMVRGRYDWSMIGSRFTELVEELARGTGNE